MPERSDSPGPGSGAHGRSTIEWRRALERALENDDHQALHHSLLQMRKELQAERVIQRAHDHGPLLERLAEHARRLLQAAPTELEALRAELVAERAVWAEFRERYRQAFVPAELHRFLDGCGVFIRPDDEGEQFPGFEKYRGSSTGRMREAVTMFRRDGSAPATDDDSAPANFFSTFDVPRGRFRIKRCYRTGLPRGAGTLCVIEQLRTLVPDLAQLQVIGFDNVQNQATYAAHVTDGGSGPVLVPDVPLDASPLGRLAHRLLAAVGLTAGKHRATLDRYGILDLRVKVARG